MELPNGVKHTADAVAGSVVAASWLDWLQGGLEIAGLILAVAYGIARLYDTKLYRDIAARLRRK